MTLKKFLKSNFFFVLLMFAIALVVGIVLYFSAFVWLGKYTQHGQEIVVPNIIGMTEEEAYTVLTERGLNIEVIDSTYNSQLPLGIIVEQNPPLGAMAKEGRSVYVITNAKAYKLIPLPDLRDLSTRQAALALKTLGIVVKDTLYEPSEFRDMVLDVRADSLTVLEVGTRMMEGDSVVLVVGRGKGTEQVFIPDVKGKTLASAREVLRGARLVIGAIEYDEEVVDESDTTKVFYIYRQTPNSGQWILEGSHVDVQLSTDTLKLRQTAEPQDEEEFF